MPSLQKCLVTSLKGLLCFLSIFLFINELILSIATYTERPLTIITFFWIICAVFHCIPPYTLLIEPNPGTAIILEMYHFIGHFIITLFTLMLLVLFRQTVPEVIVLFPVSLFLLILLTVHLFQEKVFFLFGDSVPERWLLTGFEMKKLTFFIGMVMGAICYIGWGLYFSTESSQPLWWVFSGSCFLTYALQMILGINLMYDLTHNMEMPTIWKEKYVFSIQMVECFLLGVYLTHVSTDNLNGQLGVICFLHSAWCLFVTVCPQCVV